MIDVAKRVVEDTQDVQWLEQRLAIARERLKLSERELDRINHPRQVGEIDIIDGVLSQSMAKLDNRNFTSVAIDVWRALRRNGLLKDD